MLVCSFGLAVQFTFAQTGLVTTDDGQDAYFYSWSRVKGGSDQPGWTTIFHYNGGNWEASAHSDDSIRGNVVHPLISGDGKIVTWFNVPGFCGDLCGPGSFVQTFSGIDPQSVKISPVLVISRNGRFLGNGGGMAEDLTTGQVLTASPMTGPSPFPLANDGTIIGLRPVGNSPAPVTPNVVYRWRPGVPDKDLLTAQTIWGYALSADGRHAAVEAQTASGAIQIHVIGLEDGTDQVIMEQPPGTPAKIGILSMSDDGSRLVFFFEDSRSGQPVPVYFWDQSAGLVSMLGGIPEGAAEAALSGTGAIAWVTTKTNRLVRFDLNQGTNQEILSAFPVKLVTHETVQPANVSVSGGPVPGSAIWFAGNAAIPGEHFLSSGVELPIVPNDSGYETVVQIPWEFAAKAGATGFASLPLLLQKDGYPFEMALGFGITNEVLPSLEPIEPCCANQLKVYPADFSHLIDSDHPAIPGQTIVVWMTGLGPLDRPVATGAPGPANPPARPLAHLECGLANPSAGRPWQGLTLPFVGYAPGLVGVYQVNIDVPADWPAGSAYLDCYTPTRFTTAQLPVGSTSP